MREHKEKMRALVRGKTRMREHKGKMSALVRGKLEEEGMQWKSEPEFCGVPRFYMLGPKEEQKGEGKVEKYYVPNPK
ncbi:hypothetical protein [Mesobacillus foraminis]|uniref:hypothetical protein n=1 Tax=Mesobacillus foraminis TaxID=279826 RepID=UPI000EF52957|nr:hypothetical protein [Mesobacillus foraminis]